jgi:ABC-type uncharacterized transport system permease subunit
LLYLVAASSVAVRTYRGPPETPEKKIPAVLVGFIAIVLHGIALFNAIITSGGLNLGVTNAASLVTWLAALFILLASLSQPLLNLAIVLLPLAAGAIGLDLLFPGERLLPAGTPLGIQVHVMLSILAYSALSIAALQAVILAVEDHLLHQRRSLSMMHFLPPLFTLEVLMFQLIAGGFFLLSLSLLSGFMFLENIFAQHLVHKTVLSVIAWLVFGTLLWGRHRYGWRGRMAMRYTLGGFTALMLAYFGSKVVLELILHRV